MSKINVLKSKITVKYRSACKLYTMSYHVSVSSYIRKQGGTNLYKSTRMENKYLKPYINIFIFASL